MIYRAVIYNVFSPATSGARDGARLSGVYYLVAALNYKFLYLFKTNNFDVETSIGSPFDATRSREPVDAGRPQAAGRSIDSIRGVVGADIQPSGSSLGLALEG